MTTAKMCANPCETCQKEGLPLLLTRYAIHSTETGAPPLSGQLGGDTLQKIPLGEHAQYGLRLLRSGYVYVYDEARKNWGEYFVTVDGFLTKLPPRPKQGTRPAPATNFACARNGLAPLAGVITIRNPIHATNIWIGFSDVEWTDATFEKHQSPAYRQRHMQKIVISDGKVAPQKHTAPIEQVDKLLPEFKLGANAAKKHIAPWAPFQFNNRAESSKDFKAAVQRARPQGGAAIVALTDPASIAAELDALMTYRFNTFVGDPARMRPLAVSQAVMQLEQAVRLQAIEAEEEAAEELANQMLAQPDIGMLFKDYRDRRVKQVESIRVVTPAEAKRAEDNAWKKYTAKFNEPAMKSWRKKYEGELQAFDKEHIAPLALAHRDWMKCRKTTNYFVCNFDDADLDSGHAYALTLSMCIGETQDKAACFDLYVEWLGASTYDESNLLLNALALNQEIAKQELQKAAEVSLDWRGFSWDALSAAIAETFKGKWDALANAVGELLVTRAMGPLSKVADASAASARAKLSLVTLSVFAGSPYTALDVLGGKKRFREMLVRQLIRLSKQPLNQKQLQRAVAAEIRRLEIAGEKLDGSQRKRFLVFLDEEQIRNMPKNLSAAEKVKYAAASIRKLEDIEAMEFSHWQTKLGQPRAAMIKGSLPYLVGLIGAIFQYQAMNKLGEDEQKAMAHEKKEGYYRLQAGMAAFWGTVADLAGQGLTKAAPLVPRMTKGLEFLSRWAIRLGRFAGIAGAGMVAYWDGKAGIKARGEKNHGLAALYFASAGLGVGAAGLLLLAGTVAWAGPVALILIGLLIAVAVLIEYFKDNKIQEWLKRSWWGNGPDAKYADVNIEMSELKAALA